jgi:hypothetical protein
MRLVADTLQINDEEIQEQKEFPFEVVIFSGKPLKTEKLGDFIIDLSTLAFHKKRMNVNYDHNQDDMIGYAENFHLTDEGLIATGMLHSCERTDWIIEKSRNKIEFEVSAEIDETQGIAIELQEGETAEVNGNLVSNLTIYKNVPFLGLAVCPHGTDRYTRFTLLKQTEITKMKTTTTKLKPNPTNLSDDKPPEEKKVKSQELKEFIEAFGTERGIELFQSDTSIEDVRKWNELKEKFDIPTTTPTPETTELSEEKPETPPQTPSPAEPPKEDKTNLGAIVTELRKTITTLTNEVTALKSAVPRGETEPVSHGLEPTKPEENKPVTTIDKLTAKYKKQTEKKVVNS